MTITIRTLLVAACALPYTVGAQAAPDASPAHSVPLTLGVFGGAPVLTSRIGRTTFDPSAHVGAVAELRTPLRWLTLRMDAAYQRLDQRPMPVTDAAGAQVATLATRGRLLSLAGGVVLRPTGWHAPLRPYAMAEWGAVRLANQLSGGGVAFLPVGTPTSGPALWQRSATPGVGLEISRRRSVLFAEARYQRVFGGIMPLSVGMRSR